MEYSIVRVKKDNYFMFDNMIFYRKNNRDKNKDELKEKWDFAIEYATLESENFYVFSAQTKNIFIGYISITYIPKIGQEWNGHLNGFLYIDELWVNPNHRRKGIAEALLKKADDLCQEKYISGLRIGVNTTNDAGISLYKKCGYEQMFGTCLLMQKNIVI